MKKSVVPFVSVVAFAVIASNSVHAAGVNQDDLAIAALNKLSVQTTAHFTSAPMASNVKSTPTTATHVEELNDNVIGKSQVKRFIAKQLSNSLMMTKNDLMGSESNYSFNVFGSGPIYITYDSAATAMLTD